jgi:hypothetical protein
MAKKLEIDIIAKDKSQQALNQVQGNLNKTKSSVLNLKNALLGLGAGLAIKSIVNVGKEVESLGVRFKFLFGSVDEGALAFNNLTKFASKVPFSLEAITRASGSLAVVAKDAGDLNRVLEITGNVAAVSGLDFETTAMQIQRAFSGGISAADLFRERGVNALLGFKAGATVSVEETIAKFEEVFANGGRFSGATDALAETFEGTLSMLGDKVFNFQKTIAEAGFFPEIKRQFGNLNKTLEENEAVIEQLAKKIGIGLARAVKMLVTLFKALKDNADLIATAFAGIIALKVATAFMGIATAITAMKTAMLTFNTVTKANIIFGGIAVFIGAMTILTQKFKMFKEALTDGSLVSTVTDFKSAELAAKELATQLEVLRQQKKEAQSGQEIGRDDFGATVGEVDTSGFDIEIKKVETQLEAIKELRMRFESDRFRSALTVAEKINEIKEAEFSKDIERLINKARTEEEQLAFAHANELALIQNFLETTKNLTNKQILELNDLKLALEDQYLADLQTRLDKEAEMRQANIQKQVDLARDGKIKDVDLENMGAEEKEKIAKAGMRSAIEGLASHNKEMFALNKAFRIKDAVMDTAAGITKALAMGPIGIPLAILLGALGVAQVATIASQQYTGRRTGGQVTGGTPYMVGEQGQEMFVPNQSGTIIPNDKLGGGQIINVNIHANDTQGFDELLIKRRATIVNVINDALNSQGKEALV